MTEITTMSKHAKKHTAQPPEPPRSVSVTLKIEAVVETYHNQYTMPIEANVFYEHLAAQMGADPDDTREYGHRAFERLVLTNLGLGDR
jgi:hypothetical protein